MGADRLSAIHQLLDPILAKIADVQSPKGPHHIQPDGLGHCHQFNRVRIAMRTYTRLPDSIANDPNVVVQLPLKTGCVRIVSLHDDIIDDAHDGRQRFDTEPTGGAARRRSRVRETTHGIHMVSVNDIIVQPPESDVIVDPAEWFESAGDIELEIGCGKGGFLLQRAMAFPEKRLVGIEWANKYFKYAADRMARRGVENVRIMRTDAGNFVKNHLPPECLAGLHIYHPDPWPKKRHHKRRLFQPDFVDATVRALASGARWAIQTDHAEYFDEIQALVCPHPSLRQVEFHEPGSGSDGENPQTNFEIKYTREGRAIYRLAVMKHG